MWLPFIASRPSALSSSWTTCRRRARASAISSPSRAQAHLDHRAALHRHLRIVRRLLGGVSAAAQDAVPRDHGEPRLPRAAGRLLGAPPRRAARRSPRRRARHLLELRGHGRSPSGAVLWCLQDRQLGGFVARFLVLFVTTGIGNGSTFRMIPAIFRTEALRDAERQRRHRRRRSAGRARRDSAAVIGIARPSARSAASSSRAASARRSKPPAARRRRSPSSSPATSPAWRSRGGTTCAPASS